MKMPNTPKRRPADAQKAEHIGEVGILTFHRSDNFGVILQAYGLKHFLRERGVRAEIVRYAPFFMTGRHRWVPYRPAAGLGELVRSAAGALAQFFRRLLHWREFAARRSSMDRFRREYLIDVRQPKIRFSPGLRRLPYRTYLVGSEQIWNPDITCGLRRVYFGDFQSKRKKRVIAYAASLGGASLRPQYDRKFARLLRNVDTVSLSEADAVPYVKRLYRGEVAVVSAPVFLLDKTAWQEVERLPPRLGYILVYATESNPDMAAYIHELSLNTGLRVVELGEERSGVHGAVDACAGPAEFLGYIHGATYVVTNSLHGTAFSIIYQKRFLTFAHSRVNDRIVNVLRLHGLEDRLYRTGGDIDAPVDWDAVRQRTALEVRKSEAFLLESILGRTE